MHRLSFLQNEFLYAGKRLLAQIKGLSQVHVLYYDEQSRESRIAHLKGGGDIESIRLSETLRLRLSDWRRQRQNCEWHMLKELPWENTTTVPRIGQQMGLEDEQERNVLMLSTKNLFDHQNDLMFLHFDQHLAHFGLHKAGQVLNSENKQIIQSILMAQLSDRIEELRENRSIYARIMINREQVQQELAEVKKELQHRNEFYRKNIRQMVEEWLDRISTGMMLRLEMSEEALEQVYQYRGSMAQLQQAIQQAAEIAVNTTYAEEGILFIGHEDLILPDQADVENKAVNSRKAVRSIRMDRYAGTEELLDRYEDAAVRAQELGRKIIGRELGSLCTPPITNAAISDSIKKHRYRILELFKQYPGKWPVIRSEFKSITNLIQHSDRKAGNE